MTRDEPEVPATEWSEPEIWVKGHSFVPTTFVDGVGAGERWSPDRYNRRRARRERPAEPPGGEPPGGEPGFEPAAVGNRALLANSRTMAIASLVSRATGFLRSSLLVAAIGLGAVGDAYNVANTLPNMVYELLLGGVLSSVLIPLLVQAQEDDEDDGVAYTQRLLTIAVTALAAITLLAVLAAPLFTAALIHEDKQRDLATIFAALLLPEIFFYGVGAMLMAVLNIRHSYAPGAWAPVVNNVVMIATIGLFWLLPGPSTLTPTAMTNAQVLTLGIGTTLGIAAQAVVLVPALRATGFRWQWRLRARPNETGRMKAAGQLAGWVIAYVVASQIGVSVVARVGADDKAFTIFANADLLIQMPYGILVVSLLTALMPRLSRAAARGEHDAVVADFGLGARLSAVALVPVTALLCVLGPLVGMVLFGYGRTSIQGAEQIGTALAASAFGLFPFAVVMLELRVFYAMHDGRTPTLINVWMVGTKVALVLLGAATFDGPKAIGITLTVSTSASYVVGATAGYVLLRRRLGSLRVSLARVTVVRVVLAALPAAGVALLVSAGAQGVLGHGHAGAFAGLIGGGLFGLATFWAVGWRLHIAELRDLRATVRR